MIPSDYIPMRQDINLARQWLTSVGKTADQFNIYIRYCMNLPRHELRTLEINRVTQ